jgi:hypothetical protein
MMMLKALEEFLRLVANLSAKRSLPEGPIRWLAYVAGWTLFAVFFISENASSLLLQPRPVQWHGYLVVWLTTAHAWAFLTPLVADDSAESGKSLTKLVAGPQGFEENSQFSRRSA